MAGRPLKFPTVEDFNSAVDSYFDSIKEPRVSGETVYFEPATVTGLALHLDTTRETLCDYQERDEFTDAVKRAKLRCENYAERMLYIGKNATGAIFSLKNFGWKDSQDMNLGGQKDNPVEANLTVNFVKPAE